MPDNNTPDPRVLQGLYQRWLQEAVNLAEENTRLQVRVAELEAAQADAAEDPAAA